MLRDGAQPHFIDFALDDTILCMKCNNGSNYWHVQELKNELIDHLEISNNLISMIAISRKSFDVNAQS